MNDFCMIYAESFSILVKISENLIEKIRSLWEKFTIA